jgi:spermidine/putrescine transport system permease protein
VTLPLSAPGVITGCMLVFILLMGEYLIPQLLGGGKVFFIGNALVDLFLQSLNWPFGSACAVALVVIMMVTITLYLKLTRARGQRDVSLM